MTDWLFIIFDLLTAIAQIGVGIWLIAFAIAMLRNCMFGDARFVGPFELVGLLWRGEVQRRSDAQGER